MNTIDPRFQFCPSLMCMNLLDVRSQIRVLNTHFDALHIDIMDGHFCDTIHLSPSFARSVRSVTDLPLQAHLMVERPEKFIESLAECGVDAIILHVETIGSRAFRLVDLIHQKGKMAGIALCPLTPLSAVEYLLDKIELLTVLMVDVGYVGQTLIDAMIHKLADAKKLKHDRGYGYVLQCDGGVRRETYRILCDTGAESLVLGDAALFGKHDSIDDACSLMRDEFQLAIRAGE